MDRREKPNKPEQFSVEEWGIACDYVKEHLDIENDMKILNSANTYKKICFVRHLSAPIKDVLLKNLPHKINNLNSSPHIAHKYFYLFNKPIFVCQTIDALLDFFRLKKTKYRSKLY